VIKVLLFVSLLWSTQALAYHANYDLAEKAKKRGDYKSALRYTEMQLDEDINCYGENAKEIIISYGKLGYYSEKVGEYHKALEYNFKALKIQKRLLNKNDPTAATTYNNIGGGCIVN